MERSDFENDNEKSCDNEKSYHGNNIDDLHRKIEDISIQLQKSNKILEDILLKPKYFEFYIYVDPEYSILKQLYINSANKHNNYIDNYLKSIKSNDSIDSLDTNSELTLTFDAGFDLFCPEDSISYGNQKTILDHKINCCMKFNNQFVGYYLYSRSSTPVKTPLRLANSVGIIDSGYRGNIKAVFDNKLPYDDMEYNLEFSTRYTQICPPNIQYPMKIYVVDFISDLGIKTNRGQGGFGSTG